MFAVAAYGSVQPRGDVLYQFDGIHYSFMTVLNPSQITSYFSQIVALSEDGTYVLANAFTENGTVFAFYYDGTRWIEKEEIFYPCLPDLPIGEYEGFGVY